MQFVCYYYLRLHKNSSSKIRLVYDCLIGRFNASSFKLQIQFQWFQTISIWKELSSDFIKFLTFSTISGYEPSTINVTLSNYKTITFNVSVDEGKNLKVSSSILNSLPSFYASGVLISIYENSILKFCASKFERVNSFSCLFACSGKIF